MKFNVKARKNELHRLWSLKVRSSQGFKCQWCNKFNKNNHAHHIVAVSLCGNSGRFELENGMCLCFHCHIDRLKADVDGYKEFRDRWLSFKRLDYFELRRKYQDKIKFTQEFYEQKRKEYET